MQRILVALGFVFTVLAHLNHHSHPERGNLRNQKQLYVKNPFHGIEQNPNSPVNVNAVIEIPEGQNIKFQLDEESGLMRLDRVMAMAVIFPINYGYLPRTVGEDNDPLDMMVFSSVKIPSMTLVDVRVIGVMRMNDTGEIDDKIIGVPQKDPAFNHYKEITDVPTTHINRIKAFFETYKILDNKKVTVLGFEARMAAYETIQDCENRYLQIYGP